MPRKTFASMAAASAAAARLKLSTIAAWRAFARSADGRALRVPVNPQIVYADAWDGWESFLQAGQRVSKPARQTLRPFTETRAHARSLGFTGASEWRAYARSLRCPPDMPSDPARAYAGQGWAGYPDFLGYSPETGSQKSFWSFSDARAHVRKLWLSGAKAYREWACTDQRPAGMPAHPERTYAARWKGWKDFLGGKPPLVPRRRPGPASSVYPFAEARVIARGMGLKSIREWAAYARGDRRDPRLPMRPDTTYHARGWQGWPDFLGVPALSGRARARRLLPFRVARQRVRDMRLSSARDYRERGLPLDPERLPIRPEVAYASQGWLGWGDYLGKAQDGEDTAAAS